MNGFDPYDALVPVYLETEIPQRCRQLGTAVFVEVQGEPFLYSAAHVFDEGKHGRLLAPTQYGLLTIEGYIGYVDLPPDMSRAEDQADVAYCRLSSRFSAALRHHFQPLPQDRREIIASALDLTVCSASGYPASKSKKNAEGMHSSTIFSFRGVAAEREVYESLDLSPESSIALHFHKKQAVDPSTGKAFPTPALNGISGGGIFAWPKGHETSKDWELPKLVGIVHSFKEKEGLIIGSSLIFFLPMLVLGRMKGFGSIP